MQFFDKNPGKWLKDTLSACEKKVIDREVENQKETLLSYAKSFLAQ